MKFYIHRFEANWADEFDIYGFGLFTEAEHLKIMEDKSFDLPREFYFGTNEGIDFDFHKHITVKEIEAEEFYLMLGMFGNRHGHFPY